MANKPTAISPIDGAIDSTSVTIFSNPSNGNASVNADGSVTYTPNTGFYGIDSFSYTVRDDIGAASNEATVTVIVNKRPPSRFEIELKIKDNLQQILIVLQCRIQIVYKHLCETWK